MTAAQRRRAVDHLTSRRVSQRRACRLARFSRSAAWYRPRGRDDKALRQRLRALAERYPRYGYPTLHALLAAEGRVINRKRTYRLYREEGPQVRTKRRKKLSRPRVPMAVPTQANQCWSIDFVSDQLAMGAASGCSASSTTPRANASCRSLICRSPGNAWRVNSALSASACREPSSATTAPS